MNLRHLMTGMVGMAMGMAFHPVMGQTPAQPAAAAAAAPVAQPPAAVGQGNGGGQNQRNFGNGRQRGRNRTQGREQTSGSNGGGGPVEAVAAVTGTGFSAYRLVQTRNMFDPNRYPNSMATERPRATQRTEPPPRATDYVALTGVMVTGSTELAFFSGSRPDYDRVLQPNGEIAGAKLTKITATNIEVDRDGKKIVVGLGQTVPFDANSAPGVPPANGGSGGGGLGGFGFGGPGPGPAPDGGGAQSPSAAPSFSSGLSDVMRKMMERRQQQLK